MYDFVTHTWNTVKGRCPHDCAYCYMKKWGEQPELHFDEKELKTDLGSGNFIFVGSSCDMWASGVSARWIAETVNHCINADHRDNKFLFQSKNPERFINWAFPEKTILGTTIETNRSYPEMGKAPTPLERAYFMNLTRKNGIKTMVTIEPIMMFDHNKLIDMILACRPDWVNVGANTNHKVKLTEPAAHDIKSLIEDLKTFAEVKIKSNLKRLLK